ncbi:MAG: cyclopropane-fatty-acyl-phospholipid synthase, partial [Desulfuromonadaceae bacterium]
LDERMVYSCALFHRPEEEGIDSAQYRKLDYLCRQLRLKPGEKFLDIGCAWGGLLIHAAEQYGVEALGVTPSRARAELANERIRKAGLAGRCRVEVCDYRDIPRQLSYDKLVGVGMFEPVGESQFPEYFRRAHQLLNPGGVFLYQGIIKPICRMPDNRRALIGKYAFPEGEPAPISVSLGAAEAAGFEIRDVENLREHHALTLRHWIRRLEARAEWAIALTNPSIYRVWRMYLAGLAHGFETGMLGLYQTRLVKSGIRSSGLPLAHCDWYRPCPRGHHA